MKYPVVAIVGRPNVGKSTLFNRLTKTKKAITSPVSGVTRDRHVGAVEWQGRKFLVMDTGGWVPNSKDMYETAIREQVQFALEESDVILFVGDAQTGATDVDMDIAKMLYRTDRPVILTVNKVDGPKQDPDVHLFHSLGLGDPIPVTAEGGTGVGELLDYIVQKLPERGGADEPARPRPLVAVVGRPNVGKSSFVNALLGEPRHLVTDQAGTTRDSIDSVVHFYKQPLTLIDTAGLRRKSRVKESVEFYTTVRTQRALEECDVAVVIIEAWEGLLAQDIHILQAAEALGKGIVLAINKWDAVADKDEKTAAKMERDLDDKLASFTYVPKIFISALNKQRVHKVVETALVVHEERQKRIATPELNRFVDDLMNTNPPPSIKARDLRFHYVTQPQAEPPLFVFWTKFPDLVPANYKLFLERRLRELYGFQGVPLRLVFRKKA